MKSAERQLKRFTQQEIAEAKESFVSEVSGWQAGHIDKAQMNIKFYDSYKRYCEGKTIKEISKEMDLNYSTVSGALKQTQCRIERFLKLKGLDQ